MFKRMCVSLMVGFALFACLLGSIRQANAQQRWCWEWSADCAPVMNNSGSGNSGANSGGSVNAGASNNGNSGNATGNWGTVKKIIDKWGAVAFDASRGSYGYSVHMASKLDAENTALSDCGGQSCQIMATYKNSCAALAGGSKSKGGSYVAYKWNLNNVKKAESLALSACSKKAKNCQILMSECSLP